MREFSTTARRNCLHQYGCTVEEALALNDGFEYSAKGSPMDKFRGQRWMAERRGTGWNFTFPQWKGMWDASGKWGERGTGPGQYRMVQIDSKGPYSVENIVIRQSRVTDPDGKHKRFAARIGCSLDDFASVDQMRLARKRFVEQRHRAVEREIEWLLSFSEWWAIWKESGLWELRGRDKGESAVMARNGDSGPYSKHNVRIVTLAENFAEYWGSKPAGICRADVRNFG